MVTGNECGLQHSYHACWRSDEDLSVRVVYDMESNGGSLEYDQNIISLGCV